MSIRSFALLYFVLMPMVFIRAVGVGGNGMFQWSVELKGYISNETGKAPVAYLWIPERCKKVKAVIVSQQNMTEEALYKMPLFQEKMRKLDVAMIWVAPAFSNNWDPTTGCQTIFEEMLTALSGQSGHAELERAPIIPFGHSAQATFPWNFAAWNNDRALCVISFHGDAPRTNLCGYGTANVEWGRNRNIDGIPGLMVEGEYEWWEARVNPALAFRMMYPESCISFLCDTGQGHFDCSEKTAEYIALFIEKAMKSRLMEDGKLRKLNPRDGWLACRYLVDLHQNDGIDSGAMPIVSKSYSPPAPFASYEGDPHDAFWYFDREMAELTMQRYKETKGKQMQYVGVEQAGRMTPYDAQKQGGMEVDFCPDADGITFQLKAVYTDSTHVVSTKRHGRGKLSIETISGPVRKINAHTFRIYPYEAGWDNHRRSFVVWLAAVAEPDEQFKGAVQPFFIRLPKEIIQKVNYGH
ncbi:MAG: hypothetical protein I3J02_06650 [Prevotella sp.]|nr:hypothetical protein [Prevotella sp.]